MKVDYTPTLTGAMFMRSDASVRLIKGPVGCVAPDTLVLTELGPLPIASIDRPMRVVSWNATTCQFQLSWCGGSFPKGRDYLYRVSTRAGEFAASGHHQMLCAGHEYQRVDALSGGKPLLMQCSDVPQVISVLRARSASLEDDPRSTQKAVGYLASCAESARQYGQQFLLGEDTAPVEPPSPTDVRKLVWWRGFFGGAQLGGRAAQLLKHTRRGLLDVLPRIGGWWGRLHPPQLCGARCGEVAPCEHTAGSTPLPPRSPRTSLHHLREPKSELCSCSYGYNVAERPIVAVVRERVKRAYWDMQVLDTNNYVGVDGTIHHNSGKSVVCCMEVFRRCAEMPKSTNGFRLSRWVVVRNTRDQLKKTTLKTWLDWFPDGVAGRWRESEMTYHLEVGDIRAEIMFLPLDTPDDQRRLLSLELTGGFINEAREVHPELVIAARSRMPRYPSKAKLPIDPATGKPVTYWSGLILDTNPPSEDSWIYEQFEIKKPAGWELYSQPSGLSPLAENRENLGATYYEDMMEGATEDFIRVHVHGEYGRSLIGRAVYEKTFDRDYHVAKTQLRHIDFESYPIIIGMDFGRTPAAVFLQRNAQGQVMVLDAIHEVNMGLEKFLREHVKPLLFARFPRSKAIVVGDPAGWARSQLDEKNVEDVLKGERMACVKAPTNDPVKRIAAVERQLAVNIAGQPGFLVDPRCKHLIQGMYGGYKFRRKQDGSYDVAPMKDEFSHDNDALQYGCLGLELGSLADAYGSRKREVEVHSMAAWV